MKRMHNSLLSWLRITPLLIGCLLFYAIPFILVIQYSLSTGSGGSSNFESLNYAKLSVASVLLLIVVLMVSAVFYGFVRRKEAFRG